MLHIKGICDKGLSKHKNDDRLLLGQVIYSQCDITFENDEDVFIGAISDGVSSVLQGDKAGEIALHSLRELTEINVENILNAIIMANETINKHNENEITMATTLAGVYIHQNDLIVFSIGDSRVYRNRNGYLRQLTIDDTELIYSFGNAYKSPLIQYLGKPLISPYIRHYENGFQVGDTILVTSDGLTDLVDMDHLEMIINADKSISDIAQTLLDTVYLNGAHDNISFILIKKV